MSEIIQMKPPTTPPTTEEAIDTLALLLPTEYEGLRVEWAKRLKFRLTELDKAVRERGAFLRGETACVDASTLSIDDVKVRVEKLLDSKPEEAQKKAAENLIWNYLRTHAKVYCCNGQGYFLMNEGDGVPIDVSPDSQEFNRLLISFGIHPGSPTRHRIGEFVETKCYYEGVQTETRLGFYYNPKTFTAYAASRRGEMIKVTKWGFEPAPNGTDDVLFVYPDTWQPLLTKHLDEIGGIVGTESDFPKSDMCRRALFTDGFLAQHLFGGTSFEIRSMTEPQVRILIISYILFLMMPGVVSERAMLQSLGPSSSGKTFLLELIGFILVGSRFTPRGLPKDIKEFENQLINEFFVLYDNVSKVPSEIKDRFCAAVTGVEIVRRVLFTDKREMREKSKATISLSAIKPPLPELEHANRTITINFGERAEGTFIAKEELFKVVASNRDDIVLNLLHRMTQVLEALDQEHQYIPKVNVRLASIATFILRVARHEGWEDDGKKLLSQWGAEQTGYSMMDDDISTALTRWIGRDGWEPNRELSATALNEQLCFAMGCMRKENRTNRQDLSWYGKHLTLANTIANNLKVYQERFGLVRGKSTLRHSRGNHSYTFNPGAELLQEIKDDAKYERGQLPELNFPPETLF